MLIPSARPRVIAGQSLDRAGDLDHRVGAIHRGPEPAGFGDGPRGVARELRIDLERDQSVQTARPFVHRSEGVARRLHVGHRERLEDVAGLQGHRGEIADVLVVERARRDGFLEDRRVGGHPLEAVLGDETVELPAGHQVTGDEIVPGALAQLAQYHQRIPAHDCLRARTRRTASATRSGVNPNSLNNRSPGAKRQSG
jgi:hypothetical protein